MISRRALKRYLPIDEVLEMPRVRILRALTHFDKASAEDLRIALDIDPSRRSHNLINNTLRNLVKVGAIARVGDRCSSDYRITAAGRRELAGMLRSSELPAMGKGAA